MIPCRFSYEMFLGYWDMRLFIRGDFIFIVILINRKRSEQPIGHIFQDSRPEYFTERFFGITFCVTQAKIATCAGVIGIYSPGFRVKNTLKIVGSCQMFKQILSLNSCIFLGFLIIYFVENKYGVLAMHFSQVIIFRCYCNKASFSKLAGFVPLSLQTCIP